MQKSKTTKAQQIALSNELSRHISFLVQMWANSETWFMRVLAVLLRVDVRRADLIYSNMTSTRAPCAIS